MSVRHVIKQIIGLVYKLLVKYFTLSNSNLLNGQLSVRKVEHMWRRCWRKTCAPWQKLCNCGKTSNCTPQDCSFLKETNYVVSLLQIQSVLGRELRNNIWASRVTQEKTGLDLLRERVSGMSADEIKSHALSKRRQKRL